MAQYTINFSTNASQITRELNNFQQQINRVARAGSRVNIDFGSLNLPSTERLGRELQRLERDASRISPNTSDWVELQQQIARVQLEIRKTADTAKTIQLSENLGAFSPYSLNALETRLELLKLKAKDISPSTDAWKEVNREIQNTEKSIEKITRKPLTMGQRAGAAGGAFLYGGGLGGGAGSALGGIAGGLAGGVPGAFAGAAVGQAVDSLTQYAAGIATTVAEANKAKIALAGVTKNVSDYDTAIQAATDASNKFLIPIVDSTRQFTRLQASVVGAGFDTATTAKAFEGIGAAIVATGGSTEDLNGALTATAQVFSKGKVSAEELRQQIGERIPGAFNIFAQAIGKTPQQLDKALEDGKVGLNDFIKFLEELNKRYGSTAEILAKAPENAGARLKVALQAATLSFGGFFQVVGAGFQSYFADLIKFALENESTIKRVVTIFAIGFKNLGDIVGKFARFLVNVFNGAFSAILGNLNTVLSRVEDAINRAKSVQSLTPERIDAIRKRAGQETQKRFGGGFLGIPKKGASEFYNSQLNKLIDEATGAAKKTKYTEKIQNILFPEFRPSQFGAGIRQGVSNGQLSDEGEGTRKKGRKKANDELKKYVGDRVAILQSRQKAELADVEANLLLSERDRAIQKADISLKYANSIAEEKLRVAERESLQYRIEDRKKFLDEQKQLVDIEKQTARSQFQRDIAGGLISQNENLKNSYEELLIELDAVKAGRKQVTEAAKTEVAITQALNGLRLEQASALKPVIDQARQYAAEVDRLNKLIKEQTALQEMQASMETIGAGLRAGFIGDAARTYERGLTMEGGGPDIAKKLAEMQNAASMMQVTFSSLEQSIQAIGSAFATAMTTGIASLVDGTASAKEVFASFLKTIGQTLLQAAQQMIATYISIGIARIFAGLGGGSSSIVKGVDIPIGQMPAGMAFANGGVAKGGFMPFKAFANGGVVNGPTLGLVGEGKYNEAIVPLPDGKSIPVQMRGNQSSSRDLLSSNSSSMASSPVLNMSFETTTINGTEYVSREQLEQAMMETRRLAVRDGATRGASLAIDKLQNSPNTRRRIGIG